MITTAFNAEPTIVCEGFVDDGWRVPARADVLLDDPKCSVCKTEVVDSILDRLESGEMIGCKTCGRIFSLIWWK
jgi:hypothetical protein